MKIGGGGGGLAQIGDRNTPSAQRARDTAQAPLTNAGVDAVACPGFLCARAKRTSPISRAYILVSYHHVYFRSFTISVICGNLLLPCADCGIIDPVDAPFTPNQQAIRGDELDRPDELRDAVISGRGAGALRGMGDAATVIGNRGMPPPSEPPILQAGAKEDYDD